jgi:hypothetical protein
LKCSESKNNISTQDLFEFPSGTINKRSWLWGGDKGNSSKVDLQNDWCINLSVSAVVLTNLMHQSLHTAVW